jgi:hypothetical protein
MEIAGPSGRVGLRPLACWGLSSNPAGGMDVCLLWVLCVVR